MFHLYSTRVLVFTAVQTMALSKILAEVDSMAATVFVAVVVASLIYLKSSPPPPKAESTATPASVGALMRARRSIFPKDFASDPQIPREAVERALACANWAPTHGKTEPWRFVVFGDERKEELLNDTLAWHHKMGEREGIHERRVYRLGIQPEGGQAGYAHVWVRHLDGL